MASLVGVRHMKSCRGFRTSVFTKCEAAVAFGRPCSPNAKLPSLFGRLLDVLLTYWSALACPHGLSLFWAYACTILIMWVRLGKFVMGSEFRDILCWVQR